MKQSQPQLTFYLSVIFLSWGGNILRKVESLIMMLYSASLSSLVTPSSGGLAILLCSSLTNNFNNNFVTNCGSAWPSIDNFIQPLDIGYCTTLAFCRIQLQRALLTHSFNYLFPLCFGILYHNILPALIALYFYLESHNLRISVFGLKYNVSENWWSDFLALSFFTGTDGPY